MKKITLLFVFVFSFLLTFGQASILDKVKEIRILSFEHEGLLYAHPLQAKQTIYSLAKVFQSSVDEIYQSNLKDKDYIFNINEIVKIPFRANVLITDPEQIKLYPSKTKVVYHVQPKDNLFRISRVLFPQSMDHIMENNELEDFNLSIDQKLIVGWIAKGPSALPEKSESNQNSIVSQLTVKEPTYVPNSIPQVELRLNTEISDIAKFDKIITSESSIKAEPSISEEAEVKPTKKLISKKGVALYDGKISDKENLFVLHKHAPTGSLIEIHYNLSNRRVTAQVVGKIPSRLYSNDIDLILSPKVAKMLGIKDARARVTMKYYQ